MKPYRLSEQASQSLVEIGYWTTLNFGSVQADHYIDLLIDRMHRITQGGVPWQKCRDVFAEDLRADLRLARVGRHFIIFIETPLEFHVIDIIHQSADIGGRLGGPQE